MSRRFGVSTFVPPTKFRRNRGSRLSTNMLVCLCTSGRLPSAGASTAPRGLGPLVLGLDKGGEGCVQCQGHLHRTHFHHARVLCSPRDVFATRFKQRGNFLQTVFLFFLLSWARVACAGGAEEERGDSRMWLKRTRTQQYQHPT